MREPCGAHAGDADLLVLVAGPARRADGPQHLPAGVLDEHRAGLRKEAAVRGRREADEELGIVARALGELPARRAHRDAREGLAVRDVDAEHARAVLALHGLEVARVVDDHDGHRPVARRARGGQRSAEQGVRDGKLEVGHAP